MLLPTHLTVYQGVSVKVTTLENFRNKTFVKLINQGHLCVDGRVLPRNNLELLKLKCFYASCQAVVQIIREFVIWNIFS